MKRFFLSCGLVFWGIVLSQTAFGAKEPVFSLGAGTLDLYPLQTATTTTASSTLLPTFWPYLLVQYSPWKNWAFRLRVDPLGRSVEDKTAVVRFQTLDANYRFWLSRFFAFEAGGGLFFQLISGKSGTIVLPNGTSTATFAKPGRSSLQILALLSAGLSMQWKRLHAGLVFFGTGLLTSKRAFSAALEVSVALF